MPPQASMIANVQNCIEFLAFLLLNLFLSLNLRTSRKVNKPAYETKNLMKFTNHSTKQQASHRRNHIWNATNFRIHSPINYTWHYNNQIKLWLSEFYELDFLLRHFAGNFWFQKSIYMYVFVCVYLSIYLSICVYEYMFCKVILTCSVI